MKKTKRALMSMIVFVSVFCISVIFNISGYSDSNRNTNCKTGAVSIVKPNPEGNNTQDRDSETFSYQNNSSLSDGSALSSFADTSVSQETTESLPEEDTVSVAEEVPSAETFQSQEASIEPDETSDLSAEKANTSSTPLSGLSEELLGETTLMAVSEASLETLSGDTDNSTADVTTENNTSANVSDASEAAETKAPAAEEALYANIGISIANDFVNIRKEPSTDSSILGKLYKNSAAEILDTKDGWYYIESGSVTGYIKTEFLKTGIPDDELIEKYGELTMVVAVDGLNVRENPDMESKKLTVIYQNETYPVLETADDWIKIDITDDKVAGYVKKEFAELIVDFPDAVSKEEEEELLRIQAEERAKKETEVKQQEGVSYSAEDLKLLACLVHAEAGTQSYEGKLAVANVVLNRVKSSNYPDTIKAVIYQSGQFSVAASGSLEKQLSNYNNYSSNSQLLSIKAAKAALEGSNNIGTRLYFHSYKAAVDKGYDQKSTSVKLGGHLFW